MIRVCYYLVGYFKNEIFDLSNKKINRDNYAYSHYLLKSNAEKSNIDISTSDLNSIADSDYIIFHDVFDNQIVPLASDKKKWLILFESEIISPLNWVEKSHDYFDKIFTWHDDLVDNKKYFKINFSHKFPEDKIKYHSGMNAFSDKKLCTLISGNKKVSHKLELYSERVKTIRWFEKNALDDFDLYGVGWDKYASENRYLRFLVSKMLMLEKLIAPKFPSYKGAVESKFDTLSNYKFAICYENAQMIPGYITEKIFDCFFAGCVPVYWGAPNITDHVPKNCFIDRRDFNTHEDLYAYIKNMKEDEYMKMQRNIEDYIFSEKSNPYRAETFSNTIVENILSDFI